MKKIIYLLIMFCFLCVLAWGERLIVNEETVTKRLVINASEYDSIVFFNSKFENAVLITGNENLELINFYNCDFADLVTISNNSALTSITISSGNFKKHLLINNNIIDGEVNLTDNYITGYFQFSNNCTGDEFTLGLSRIEGGISCFNNIFLSKSQINKTTISLRSVFYGNLFYAFDFNDVNFGMLTMQDNYLEKYIGFIDCTITASLAIRKLNDIGNNESNRSVSFYNTSVLGSVYFDDINTTILLYNLWQLDFYQELFIDYERLINSIGLVTDRVVHSPQNIENIAISNPYNELSTENLQKFKQLISRIMSGFDKRSEKDLKIKFVKWEYHYRNNFNDPFKKLLNKILFDVSFELFLNIYRPIIFSLVVCFVFMVIYLNKKTKEKDKYRYLKIDHLVNRETTDKKKRVSNVFERLFIAFGTSISVFCNIPLATKKLREDEARNITWTQGMFGIIMLMIIAAIVSRIATI